MQIKLKYMKWPNDRMSCPTTNLARVQIHGKGNNLDFFLNFDDLGNEHMPHQRQVTLNFDFD